MRRHRPYTPGDPDFPYVGKYINTLAFDQELRAAGVDHLNTDDLHGLKIFLDRNA